MTIARGVLATATLAVTIAVVDTTVRADDDAGCALFEDVYGAGCEIRTRTSPPPPLPGSPPPEDPALDPGGERSTETAIEADGSEEEPVPVRNPFERPDADTSIEAAGGGGGTPPPSCVERVVRRGGKVVNTIDATGLAGITYQRDCADGTTRTIVRPGEQPAPDPGGAPLPPLPPDPADLADELYDSMFVRLPSPTIHITPADHHPKGWVYVQYPSYFWIDEWVDLTSTLTVGPVSVTLAVVPERVDIDLGNGDIISCIDPTPAGLHIDPATFDGCEYTYRHSSSVAPNGHTWPVTASMVWSVSWTSNIGIGDDFGEVHTTTQRPLAVAERQAIIVDTHSDG